MRDPVTRWRYLALTVGTGLVILVFIGVPLKYLAGYPDVVAIVGAAHGFLYMVYVVLSLDLARRLHWQLPRLALTILAGTVPLLTFVVERRVAHELAANTVILTS